MRDYPQAALRFSGEAHDEVRPLAASCFRVWQRIGAHVAEAQLFQLLYQIFGLVEFADASVSGTYRRDGDQVAQGLHHFRLKLFYLCEKFFFQNLHLVFSVFNDTSQA